MHDIIQSLNEMHILWILLAAGLGLVLVDYFFPTDWPAFLGYACFSGAVFFAVGTGLTISLGAAAGALVALLVLHRLVFSRFLTNAPGKNPWDAGGDTGEADAGE